MPALKDKTVLVIGRGSGIAGAIAQAANEAGGQVIAAGRHPDGLAAACHGMDVGIEQVDVTDEASIAALAGRASRGLTPRYGATRERLSVCLFSGALGVNFRHPNPGCSSSTRPRP